MKDEIVLRNHQDTIRELEEKYPRGINPSDKTIPIRNRILYFESREFVAMHGYHNAPEAEKEKYKREALESYKTLESLMKEEFGKDGPFLKVDFSI